MINNIVLTNYSNMTGLLKNYDIILDNIKKRQKHLINENQSIYDVIHKLDDIGVYELLSELYHKFILFTNDDINSYQKFYYTY